MTNKERAELVKVRLQNSAELYEDAYNLFVEGSFKSANNRAYYSLEKSLKALLAIKGIDAITHNGVLVLFNQHFIYNNSSCFTKEDYKIYQSVEYIRSASDYDDFYIASKSETEEVLTQVKQLNDKVKDYVYEQQKEIEITRD
ncbi:MAG: HEPN domain-containing protein [Lachnospiraceae bacterium]|nr:HEPN domain-containing protein [Lachnospiraceae bacterium]MBQ8319028.1 HEPN domain-containing protein [Lachnospiraceae bacterium]